MWKGNKGDGSSRYQWVERDGEGRGEAMVKVVWRERMDGGGEQWEEREDSIIRSITLFMTHVGL